MAKNKHGGSYGGGRGKNFLERLEARQRAEADAKQQFQTDFLLQIGCDAFFLTAADLFDLQPGRAVEAMTTYREYIMVLMDNLIDDSRDDQELTYFWTDLDRRMKQIVGEDAFVPREERYDETGERIMHELLIRYAARVKARREAEAKNGE